MHNDDIPLVVGESQEVEIPIKIGPILADFFEAREIWDQVQALFDSLLFLVRVEVDTNVKGVCIQKVEVAVTLYLHVVRQGYGGTFTIGGNKLWVRGFDGFGFFHLVFDAAFLRFTNLSVVFTFVDSFEPLGEWAGQFDILVAF